MYFINKTAKYIYNINVFFKSWKVIQNQSKSFQNSINAVHEDWFGSDT